MSGRSFRFLHASDLHLEQPLRGVSQVPDHLQDLFLDAPYQAAEQIFDKAIHEHVDFLLMAGGVLESKRGGARSLDFLIRQFLRLQEAKIDIYWAGDLSESEGGGWPAAVPLPDNVHRFLGGEISSFALTRDGRPVATIRGGGPGSQSDEVDVAALRPNATEGFSIAVAHGQCGTKDVRGSGIAYLALGGRNERRMLAQGAEMAQYCGSPQGRDSKQLGPHGCVLVDVDSRGTPHSQFVATDIVRWSHEEIELGGRTDQAELSRVLLERSSRRLEDTDGRQVLLQWSIRDNNPLADTPSDKLAAELRQHGLAERLLKQLQNSLGSQVPGVWPVSLEAAPPAELPSGWYEEETVLGDLLRLIQHYQQEPNEPLDLARSLEDPSIDPTFIHELRVDDPAEREELLRRVAVLGVDLLRGNRVLSNEEEEHFAWMDRD